MNEEDIKQLDSPEKHEEAVKRYISIVYPEKGDPTYLILRTHLLIEELLRDLIAANFKHPEALDGARLNFSQILTLAKAGTLASKPEMWHWTAIDKLNKLRNLFAHHINHGEINKKSNELILYIESNIEQIKPSKPKNNQKQPQKEKSSDPSSDASPTRLERTLIALYGTMKAILDIEKLLRQKNQKK